MKLNYLLFCDHAGLDSSQKLNVSGIFDVIYTPGVPTIHQSMWVVFELVGVESARVDFRMSVKQKSTGAVMAEMVGGQAFDPSAGNRYRVMAQADNVPFPQAGEYEVDLVVNGERMPVPNVLSVIVRP